MSAARRSTLNTIFLTVFIDMLGVGIIIPVIPALFFEPSSNLFSADVSETYRSVLYGFLIASFPLMQFFGAPVLGALSDRYGRKPVLLISLFGTLIGYLLFAVAIRNQLIGLLFVSRMLPGFTGGNISVIYSALADISKGEARVKNFGLVGVAFGLGFILGPTIGGVLADASVISWFDSATPFWFTAMLTVVNLIYVQWSFPETLTNRQQSKISAWTGVRNVSTAFQKPHLRIILTVVFLLSMGFNFFTQFFSVYLIQVFDYSEKNIGFLFGWIGIWLALTQGVMVRRLADRFPPKRLLLFSILGLSLAVGLILIPQEAWWFYLLSPLVAMAQGVTSPNLTASVSEQAMESEQGQVLGIYQSMLSVGQIIPPLIAGYANAINGNLPILFGSGLILIGWMVYTFVFLPGEGRKSAD